VPTLQDELFHAFTAGKVPTRARLVVLLGLPFSGKSTVAQKLAEMGYVHVWATIIRKRYAVEFEDLANVMERLVERLLEAGFPVVVDNINHTESTRRRFVYLAERMVVRCDVLWMNPGADVIRRRRLRTQRQGGSEGRSTVSLETMHRTEAEFEPPTGRFIEVTEADAEAALRAINA